MAVKKVEYEGSAILYDTEFPVNDKELVKKARIFSSRYKITGNRSTLKADDENYVKELYNYIRKKAAQMTIDNFDNSQNETKSFDILEKWEAFLSAHAKKKINCIWENCLGYLNEKK